jgi:hypothetical protein
MSKFEREIVHVPWNRVAMVPARIRIDHLVANKDFAAVPREAGLADARALGSTFAFGWGAVSVAEARRRLPVARRGQRILARIAAKAFIALTAALAGG